jgi:hypothetical protein
LFVNKAADDPKAKPPEPKPPATVPVIMRKPTGWQSFLLVLGFLVTAFFLLFAFNTLVVSQVTDWSIG